MEISSTLSGRNSLKGILALLAMEGQSHRTRPVGHARENDRLQSALRPEMVERRAEALRTLFPYMLAGSQAKISSVNASSQRVLFAGTDLTDLERRIRNVQHRKLGAAPIPERRFSEAGRPLVDSAAALWP